MTQMVFKRTDGSSYTMKNIPDDMAAAIWDEIDSYCELFESETIKVRTVIQKEQQ